MHTLGCPTGAGKPPAAGLHLGTLHLGPRHPRQEISVHTLGCPTTTGDGRTVHLGTWGLVSQQRAPDKHRPAIKRPTEPIRTPSRTTLFSVNARMLRHAPPPSSARPCPRPRTPFGSPLAPCLSTTHARTHARTIRQAPSMPLVSHSPPPRGSPNTHLPPPHLTSMSTMRVCCASSRD